MGLGLDPGWYEDPHAAGQERYWDGFDWTEAVRAAQGAEKAPDAVLEIPELEEIDVSRPMVEEVFGPRVHEVAAALRRIRRRNGMSVFWLVPLWGSVLLGLAQLPRFADGADAERVAAVATASALPAAAVLMALVFAEQRMRPAWLSWLWSVLWGVGPAVAVAGWAAEQGLAHLDAKAHSFAAAVVVVSLSQELAKALGIVMLASAVWSVRGPVDGALLGAATGLAFGVIVDVFPSTVAMTAYGLPSEVTVVSGHFDVSVLLQTFTGLLAGMGVAAAKYPARFYGLRLVGPTIAVVFAAAVHGAWNAVFYLERTDLVPSAVTAVAVGIAVVLLALAARNASRLQQGLAEAQRRGFLGLEESDLLVHPGERADFYKQFPRLPGSVRPVHLAGLNLLAQGLYMQRVVKKRLPMVMEALKVLNDVHLVMESRTAGRLDNVVENGRRRVIIEE